MNAWFAGGAIRAIIGKIDPLCGAAQHTDVWGVPRPDVDRVSDREQAFRHIQGGIQRRRNRIVERDGQHSHKCTCNLHIHVIYMLHVIYM